MLDSRLITPSRYSPGTILSPADEQLVSFVESCYDDPLRFVTGAYPWGEPGLLQHHDGPDTWQTEFLIELGEEIRSRKFDGVHPVDPIQMTRASGHGVGKSTIAAMLCNFILSTRPHSKGTLTANTYNQLKQKTWSTVKTWNKRSITGHWFDVQAEGMFRIGAESSWFANCASCADENSEAFAGQHAADSTSFYLFDEGSNISDKIFEVADGGLSDGEPMIFVFGNPTRITGKFFRINFGGEINRWNHGSIDSRQSRFTNLVKIEKDKEEWGEDSDRFRVRVRGLPPATSDMQFISTETIREAQLRVPPVLANDPLICGLDVARGGKDNCVFRFRRGLDAKSIPPIKLAGEKVRDSNILLSQAVTLLKTGIKGRRIDMMFIDGTGVGGPICDQLKNMGFSRRIIEVQFGSSSPNMPGYEAAANMRSWMWVVMKEWLNKGAIDEDTALEMDLKAPMFQYRQKTGDILLESKESMSSRLKSEDRSGSPDDGDALALTFAYPVQPLKSTKQAAVDDEGFDEDADDDYESRHKATGWG